MHSACIVVSKLDADCQQRTTGLTKGKEVGNFCVLRGAVLVISMLVPPPAGLRDIMQLPTSRTVWGPELGAEAAWRSGKTVDDIQ
jgi:hypothetical protein